MLYALVGSSIPLGRSDCLAQSSKRDHWPLNLSVSLRKASRFVLSVWIASFSTLHAFLITPLTVVTAGIFLPISPAHASECVLGVTAGSTNVLNSVTANTASALTSVATASTNAKALTSATTTSTNGKALTEAALTTADGKAVTSVDTKSTTGEALKTASLTKENALAVTEVNTTSTSAAALTSAKSEKTTADALVDVKTTSLSADALTKFKLETQEAKGLTGATLDVSLAKAVTNVTPTMANALTSGSVSTTTDTAMKPVLYGINDPANIFIDSGQLQPGDQIIRERAHFYALYQSTYNGNPQVPFFGQGFPDTQSDSFNAFLAYRPITVVTGVDTGAGSPFVASISNDKADFVKDVKINTTEANFLTGAKGVTETGSFLTKVDTASQAGSFVTDVTTKTTSDLFLSGVRHEIQDRQLSYRRVLELNEG